MGAYFDLFTIFSYTLVNLSESINTILTKKVVLFSDPTKFRPAHVKLHVQCFTFIYCESCTFYLFKTFQNDPKKLKLLIEAIFTIQSHVFF